MTDRRSKPRLAGRQYQASKEPPRSPLASLPPAPQWISPEAARWWDLLGIAAIEAGALCGSDLPALGVAAITMEALQQAQRRLAEGDEKAARDVANLAGKLLALLQQLGLTPRARQLLPQPEPQQPESAFALIKRR